MLPLRNWAPASGLRRRLPPPLVLTLAFLSCVLAPAAAAAHSAARPAAGPPAGAAARALSASAEPPAAGATPATPRRERAPQPRHRGGFVGFFDELLAPGGLARDLAGLLSGRDPDAVLILGMTAAGTAISKDAIDELAFRGLRRDALHDFSETMSTLGGRTVLYPALIGTFAAGRALGKGRVRRIAAHMTQALVITDLLVTPVKVAVGRRRPDGSNSRSFPSGHAAGSFALASVLQEELGIGAGIPAFAVATMMGIARVDQRRHYMTDVLAGAAFGLVAARMVNRRFGSRLLLLPAPVAGGGGLVLHMTF